jgi:hypothetical protein
VASTYFFDGKFTRILYSCQVRSLGAIRDQSLSLFWDKMPLRVAVYDIDSAQRQKAPHSAASKQYYLLFELKNSWNERSLDENSVHFQMEDDMESISDDDEEEEEGLTGLESPPTVRFLCVM